MIFHWEQSYTFIYKSFITNVVQLEEKLIKIGITTQIGIWVKYYLNRKIDKFDIPGLRKAHAAKTESRDILRCKHFSSNFAYAMLAGTDRSMTTRVFPRNDKS